MDSSRFVDDINIKNALSGILIRSPVVSGQLVGIKTPKLPFNVSLVTASDIPGEKFCYIGQNDGHDGQSQNNFQIPIFPENELSWYGQPVGMLLGPDPAKLRELAEHCLVHIETKNNEQEESRVFIERNFSVGPVTEAFEKATQIIEGKYYSGLQDPWPSDTLGAIAIPGHDGSITIHTSTQWPGHVLSSVAKCLNKKSSLVDVEVSRLEIHLDSKIWTPSLLSCQAAVGAIARGKPVKLILKRDEEFLFSPKSAGTAIFIQSALDKHGAILGSKVKIEVEFGAFGIFAREILDRFLNGWNSGGAAD
jgi:xanthine dehydrogenase molybdopterin-binding subunit B